MTVSSTKITVQTLLNELFSLDKENNKKIIEDYIINKNINFG